VKKIQKTNTKMILKINKINKKFPIIIIIENVNECVMQHPVAPTTKITAERK
jgi:hypothetical protein